MARVTELRAAAKYEPTSSHLKESIIMLPSSWKRAGGSFGITVKVWQACDGLRCKEERASSLSLTLKSP